MTAYDACQCDLGYESKAGSQTKNETCATRTRKALMFQKDYWRMNDQTLAQEAIACHISIEGFESDESGNVSWQIFPRDYIIASLVGRDQALRTRWVVGVTVLSFLLSLAAFIVSLTR